MRNGSTLAERQQVIIVDASGRSGLDLLSWAQQFAPLGRIVVTGVEDAGDRAALLALGCGDVVGAPADRELEARVARIAERLEMLPRRRVVGPVTLDLFYRDAWHGRRRLGLHPREFEVLWRLAELPGVVVTRRDLLRDVWRLSCEPETNSVEVHICRLRTKLAAVGCGGLIATVPDGGYRLTASGLHPVYAALV